MKIFSPEKQTENFKEMQAQLWASGASIEDSDFVAMMLQRREKMIYDADDIKSLILAMDNLILCARLSGGIAGRDIDLCAALDEAEKAVKTVRPPREPQEGKSHE